MTLSALGGLVALLLAGAVLMAVSWWRAHRPLSTVARIAPFVRGIGLPTQASLDATIALPDLLRRRGADSRPGTSRAGAPDDRWSTVAWMAAGGVIGLAAAALATADDPRPLAWLALTVTGAAGGRWLRHLRAQNRSGRDRRLMAEQVPVLADLLALAVSAGASPLAALDRATTVLGGPLGAHLSTCVARMRTGMPLEEALDLLAAEARVPSLTRLLEVLAVAHGRGTPLTDVVRAQAADARADERRRLLELAGRKDVAMLVPIVFLVLPMVILIAVFPGIRALEVVVP